MTQPPHYQTPPQGPFPPAGPPPFQPGSLTPPIFTQPQASAPDSVKPKKRPWFRSAWVLAPATLVLGMILGSAMSSGSAKPAAPVTVSVTQTETAAAKPASTVTVTAPAVTVTADAPAAPAAPPGLEDGTYMVGSDVALGTYKSSGGASDLCYADTQDKAGKILEQEVSTGASVVIRIKTGAYTFTASGCGSWTKVG